MLVNSDIRPPRQTIKTEAAHIVDCKNEPNSYALDEKNIMSLIIQKKNQSHIPHYHHKPEHGIAR